MSSELPMVTQQVGGRADNLIAGKFCSSPALEFAPTVITHSLFPAALPPSLDFFCGILQVLLTLRLLATSQVQGLGCPFSSPQYHGGTEARLLPACARVAPL